MKITVVTPVFNDWDSFSVLHKDLCRSLAGHSLSFVVVNDGSTILPTAPLPCDVVVINLTRNMGHQKAIAIGLSYTVTNIPDVDNVIVLDSDGEDAAGAAVDLIGKSIETGTIIFASRGRRYEGLLFKAGYIVYRLIFRLFTGGGIRFGNYSCIPRSVLLAVTSMPEIWYNYPGAVAASRLPYGELKVDRAKRYFGKSKMDFMSLILHGFGAIAIQLDRIAVRAMIVAALGALLSISGIIAVLCMKFIVNMATPGWATSAIGGLTVIMLQFMAIAALAFFFAISHKNQRGVIPAVDWKLFVREISQSKK